MSENRRIPAWLKPIINMGMPSRHLSGSKHTFRTRFYRYLWGMLFLGVYLLFVIYLLGGDDTGSSSNTGIGFLLLGAFIFFSLGAFFSPRLNERFQMLTPSGRRLKVEKEAYYRKKKGGSTSSHRSSRSSGDHHHSQGASSQVDNRSDRSDS